MAVTSTLADLHTWAGTSLGHTTWQTVTQEIVNDFAAGTRDHQWIHTDPERAAASQFGGTIAHGMYLLSPPFRK